MKSSLVKKLKNAQSDLLESDLYMKRKNLDIICGYLDHLSTKTFAYKAQAAETFWKELSSLWSIERQRNCACDNLTKIFYLQE